VVFALKIWRHYLYGARFEVFSDNKSLKYLFDQKELKMRQRRWMKFHKDYDFELQYHPGKANVVADALSRKSIHASMMMVKELDLIESFRDLNLAVKLRPNSICLGMLKISSEFLEEIKRAQERDQSLQENLIAKVEGKESEFHKDSNGIKFRDRICILAKEELRKLIMEEAHKSSLSIHLGATKMYQDLKKMFWWSGMKKAVVEFVARCLVC